METESVSDNIRLEKIRLYDNEQASTIFLFSEDIIVHVDNSQHKICVGFYYDEVKKRIVTENRQNIYCFFQTKEALDTCFIVHAPFLLTDNRQNLKPNEPLNRSLIDLLADLSGNAILYLRDYGIKNRHLLIDKNIVKFIPEVKTDYWGNILQPLTESFHHAIVSIISTKEILLTINNTYVSCSNAIISDLPEIPQLFQKKDFLLLHGGQEDEEELGDKDFLKRSLVLAIQGCDYDCFSGIETYTINDLLDDLNAEFLESKDIKWVIKLYSFLKKNIRLNHWKPSVSFDSLDITSRKLYKAPIIHTASKEWIPFLNDDNLPQVFFAPRKHRGLKYAFVDKEYVKIEEAKEFLEYLGVKQPEEKDYIYNEIIPKYGDDTINATKEEIADDFFRLLKYYISVKKTDEARDYINRLNKSLWLASNDGYYRRGCAQYFKSQLLDELYQGDYFWIDLEYYKESIDNFGIENVKDFLILLGVNRYPKIEKKSYRSSSEIEEENPYLYSKISSSYFYDFRVEDYVMKSFKEACSNHRISQASSIILWNEVLPTLSDYVECTLWHKQYRQRYYRSSKYNSLLIEEFANLDWLYTKDGQIVKPQEIQITDLHPSYNRSIDSDILRLLKFKPKEKSIIELGGTAKQEKQRNIGEHFELLAKSKGWSVEELFQKINNMPNKEDKVASIDVSNTFEDTKKESAKKEKKEELSNIKARLEKKWDEKGNIGIHHPYSTHSAFTEIDTQTKGNGIQSDGQPLFSENTLVCSFNDDYKSNNKRTESAFKTKETEATGQAERAKEQREIYDWFNQTPKFTFLWFKLLMELMHIDKGKQSPLQVEIDFSEWKFTCSGKVLHLENPNRPLPTWATESSFSISTIGETPCKLKGIIAKSDERSLDIALDTDDQYKNYCATARIIRVVMENDANFIDTLDKRFLQLGFEDDYDMNKNLPKDIEFIYGPPGTGKTTMLVKRLHDIVKNREKVNILVLTPTNKAADVIAQKMVDDNVCYGCLTRFGATESLYLIEDAAVVTNRSDTDITLLDKNILVTTAARYAYDFVQPNNTFICDVDWDYIVIDEASMVDLQTITYILYKGRKAEFIISGDPKQIPPVVQNNIPAYNIYDMVGLKDFESAIKNYNRYVVTALQTQYRSIPVIGNAVSKFAYNGLLKTWNKRTKPKELELDGIDIKNFNFIGFDTVAFDPILELGAIGKSAFHLYSVIFTYNMVKYVVGQISKKYRKESYTIGIVCPYKAQASAIGKMLESNPIETDNCHISCGTIHSFQGDECDVMFLLMNPPANCTTGSHVNEEYIINVGISRARDYLFILLPKGQCKGFYRKQQLGSLVDNNERAILDCSQIEEVIFGQKNYIYSHTHVTCHMPVNVYCEENAKYEVKISDDAIDIKIGKD